MAIPAMTIRKTKSPAEILLHRRFALVLASEETSAKWALLQSDCGGE
jgi:hypothetical protein